MYAYMQLANPTGTMIIIIQNYYTINKVCFLLKFILDIFFLYKTMCNNFHKSSWKKKTVVMHAKLLQVTFKDSGPSSI